MPKGSEKTEKQQHEEFTMSECWPKASNVRICVRESVYCNSVQVTGFGKREEFTGDALSY